MDIFMAKFRFEDLEIWELAIEIADRLFDIADDLERRRLYRFAGQLRGAGMSMSNNIAEGSGSRSNKVFIQYLEYARNSTFENANILILMNRRGLVSDSHKEVISEELDKLCRKITNFQKSLKR
ncbi:four helix bundle protein [Rhodohalobacter sp. SW132]|uniref:four helix bundle protein n=1 Tax=Rhodohalobacter sp. SW132 TaxID=2293433 RepID=UPI0018F7A12F|nr:four helix bundle protein [Rhodohalobacter sp. SW132]